ncbi:hypothetical protein ACIO14_25835 [Nocardia fluminea]|uniref:hypothetical protein n=1 Tax=Nocardia fluminea TaxID=134984 RepID=UPI003812CCD2
MAPGARSARDLYVTLVPVAFPLSERTTVARALTIAQRAYDSGLLLAPNSFHRVLDLLPPDSEIKAEPGWVTPMISFIDARDFLGNELFDSMNAGVFANRAASEEALIWINRLPGRTSMSAIFPDTGLPGPFPPNVMPIAGGLTMLRGLDFADGLVETVDVWLAPSVHWPLLVRVEKQVVFAGPAGVFPCWQVRLRPGFEQVNGMLDKMVGSVVPPFIALFEVAAPHRMVQLSFPTQMSMSAPRATMELVS